MITRGRFDQLKEKAQREPLSWHIVRELLDELEKCISCPVSLPEEYDSGFARRVPLKARLG